MPKKVTMATTENEVAPTPVSQPATKTVSEQIKDDYRNGAFSPLQLAYKYSVEIDAVLVAIEQPEMLEVQIVGDQIDSAGPGVAINYGSRQKINYSKN
jgi:hypothetical protein